MLFKLQTHSYRLQPMVMPRLRTVPLPSLLNPMTLQGQQSNLDICTRIKKVFWNCTTSWYCKGLKCQETLTQAVPLQKNRVKWPTWAQWPGRKTSQQPALLRNHAAQEARCLAPDSKHKSMERWQAKMSNTSPDLPGAVQQSPPVTAVLLSCWFISSYTWPHLIHHSSIWYRALAY